MRIPCLLTVAIASALLFPACTTAGRRMPDGGGGTGDSGGGTGDAGPGHDANLPDTGMVITGDCSAEARWIYLVDSDNALLRFEPDANTLTRIGTLDCPGSASPFSMAVDRNAIAYVLHDDHNIYQVSTVDASCAATSYTPDRMGFEAFGMGFVSDVAGGETETLFIAGGPATGIGGGSSTLGAIQVSGWTISTIGDVDGSPELTGNGNAELWGFFPDATPMAVRQMDKTNGATIREFDVSSIDSSIFGAIPSAWAFAFWGGRYYIFYMGALDSSTGIYRLTPDTGEVEPVMTDIGYRIVGAGVSTCAPTILI
jgi:hypothetical protein